MTVISQLPPVQVATTQDLFPVMQPDGVTRYESAAQILANGAAAGTGALTQQAVLSAVVSGGMAVASGPAGVYPASAATMAGAVAFIGISTQSGIAGATVLVTQAGLVIDTGWAWTPGLPVFLGLNGGLTQTPPTTGVSMVVASAVSATEIALRSSPPIQL